jgi:hypothetical protein
MGCAMAIRQRHFLLTALFRQVVRFLRGGTRENASCRYTITHFRSTWEFREGAGGLVVSDSIWPLRSGRRVKPWVKSQGPAASRRWTVGSGMDLQLLRGKELDPVSEWTSSKRPQQ